MIREHGPQSKKKKKENLKSINLIYRRVERKINNAIYKRKNDKMRSYFQGLLVGFFEGDTLYLLRLGDSNVHYKNLVSASTTFSGQSS